MPLAFPPDSDRLPPGRHAATTAEIEAALVDAFPASARRRPLFEQWRTLNAAIEHFVAIREQWLDGSYVTTKLDPRDVDVVSIVNGSELEGLDAVEEMLLVGLVSGHASRDLHGCDSFLVAEYPPGHPARPTYEAARRYWDDLFRMHRDGNPKGYVQHVTDA
jgi:hypothetical protein